MLNCRIMQPFGGQMNQKLNGYKPSSDDLICNTYALCKPGLIKLASNLDSEYRIPEFTPISDQSVLNSCSGNATVDAFEILMGLEGNVVQLSRLFTYWNARVYDNSSHEDEGSYIHLNFKSLQTLGVCLESDWTYNTNKVFAQPTLHCYKTANDNKIDSFYRIVSKGYERLNDIESAVRANHPVVFGTAIDKSFQNTYNKEVTFDIPSTSIGNHAMIVVGVRRNEDGRKSFLIRNSWGEGWGHGGRCWMTEEYLMWNKTMDIWVATKMPQLI